MEKVPFGALKWILVPQKGETRAFSSTIRWNIFNAETIFKERYKMGRFLEQKYNEQPLEPYSKAKVQYDKQFPTLFDMGNISKDDERIINAIISELHRLPYSEKGIELDYKRIAMLVGGQYIKKITVNGRKVMVQNNQDRFNAAIQNIGLFLSQVHYKKVTGVDEYGIPNRFDHILLFKDKFTIDLKNEKLTVYLSDYTYQDEVLDENGAVEIPKKRVYELFYQEDWSKTQYLKYSLFIHNSLSSQYTMRLYREIAGYRSYGTYYAYADRFESEVMKYNTPALRHNKSVTTRKAFEELKQLKDQFGNPIIPGLEMEIERRGRNTYKYTFTFKPFKNDLLPILGRTEQGFYILQFPGIKYLDTSEQEDEDYKDVLNAFQTTFGTDNSVDNPNNRQLLKDWLCRVDKNVIIEMLRRTGNRTFGWTVRGMESILSKEITTVSELNKDDQRKFNKKEAMIQDRIEKDARYQKLFDLLKDLIEDVAPIIIEDIDKYINDKHMDIEVVTAAIKEATFQNSVDKKNWKYVTGILKSWLKEGIYTVEQLERYLNAEEIAEEATKKVKVSAEFLDAMNLWSE